VLVEVDDVLNNLRVRTLTYRTSSEQGCPPYYDTAMAAGEEAGYQSMVKTSVFQLTTLEYASVGSSHASIMQSAACERPHHIWRGPRSRCDHPVRKW